MAFRSNPRPKFMGPSPWLQGAPPSALLPNPMQGQAPMMNQGPRQQGMGFNPIVSQLALANNLLSSALTKNQGGFGGPGGRGILGSAPQSFPSGGPGMMRNMMMQGGPDPKRMRMGPGTQGIPPFNQRPRMPFNTANRPQNRTGRDQPQQLFNRDRNQARTGVKRTRWEEEKNKKVKESPNDTINDEKSASEPKKDTEEIVMSSGDEKTYDPSSPTSDVELKDNEEETKDEECAEAKDEAQGILQVTIQKGMKGRSVSKEGESGAASQGPMFCHVCNISCSNLENFHKHMNSKSHKVQMDSLITLHEAKTKQLEARMKASDQLRKIEDTERGKGSYCNICKSSYTGSAILHKRTAEHKKWKELSGTSCRQCNITEFNSRQEYEEHCKTQEHAKALEEWTKEHGNEEAEDWQDDDEDQDDEDVGEVKHQDSKADSSEKVIETSQARASQSPVGSAKITVPPTTTLGLDDKNSTDRTQAKQITADAVVDPKSIPPYNPDKPIITGRESVVPLSGLFCKLCRKFYKDQDSADMHCQSKPHYDNYKKSMTEKTAANLRKLKELKDVEKIPDAKPKSILKKPSKPEEKKDVQESSKDSSKTDIDDDASNKDETEADEAVHLASVDSAKDEDATEADSESGDLKKNVNKDAQETAQDTESADISDDEKLKKESSSPSKGANTTKPKPVIVKKTPQRGRGRGRK